MRHLLSLVLTLLVLTTPAFAESTPFTLDLALGSSGAQVLLLQQLLNRDPDTRIAETGLGSPSRETGLFGALTRAAVIKFQEKYAREVLSPAGLTRGTGRVGPLTRAKLNALASPQSVTGSIQIKTPTTTPTTPPQQSSTSIAPTSVSTTNQALAAQVSSSNPNARNLDKFLTAIDTAGATQNYSPTTLATIKEQVVKDAATTTDLRALFLQQEGLRRQTAAAQKSIIGRALIALWDSAGSLFAARHARAAAGTPFGGAIVYPYYCTCSNTWLIGITPLPPSYAVLLSYQPGSQAFLSYNIPFTTWLLGEYTPGAGACYVYAGFFCFPIPNEGMISPMTGSSPS